MNEDKTPDEIETAELIKTCKDIIFEGSCPVEIQVFLNNVKDRLELYQKVLGEKCLLLVEKTIEIAQLQAEIKELQEEVDELGVPTTDDCVIEIQNTEIETLTKENTALKLKVEKAEKAFSRIDYLATSPMTRDGIRAEAQRTLRELKE